MRVAALVLLAAATPAQSVLVSPAALATTEGNSSNTFPFLLPGRYQQAHGDLRATPLAVRALWFRRDGVATAFPSWTARTLDAALWMTWTNVATFGPAFDANHGPVRLQVIARRAVVLPDLTQPQGAPAPWTVRIPLDLPFPYPGAPYDLAWDMRVYATSAPQAAYSCDAFRDGSSAGFSSGTGYGSGCVAVGRSLPMRMQAQFHTNAPANLVALHWHASELPGGVAAALLIGAPAEVAVPGLCRPLYVNPSLAVAGTSTASGVFAVPAGVLPYAPALAGVPLSAQTVAVDPRSPQPIPVALTHRVTAVVPPLPSDPAPIPVRRAWANGSPDAEVGTVEGVASGLVTAFEQ